MKALTIRQPWAWAIARGFKDVELRPQLYTYRGRLAIHAGLHLGDAEAFRFVDEHADEAMPALGLPGCPTELALGAVIAVATLSSAHLVSDCMGACSPWVMDGYRAHHMLTDVRILKRPVPARGNTVLWTPDDDTTARIARQL